MEKSRLHLDGSVSVDMTTGFAFVRTFPPTHHKVPDGSQCQIYNISVDEGEKKVKKKKKTQLKPMSTLMSLQTALFLLNY